MTLPSDSGLAGSQPDSSPADVEIAFNGDIEFWDFGTIRRTFFACFTDGRCKQILSENDYRDRMEKARRWALSQDDS